MDQGRLKRIAKITSEQKLVSGNQSPAEQDMEEWRNRIAAEALETARSHRRSNSMTRSLGATAAVTELEPEPQDS